MGLKNIARGQVVLFLPISLCHEVLMALSHRALCSTFSHTCTYTPTHSMGRWVTGPGCPEFLPLVITPPPLGPMSDKLLFMATAS